MLLKYNCHINVVVCSGIKMVKYLHKYVFKGNDRLKVQLSEDQNSQGRQNQHHIRIEQNDQINQQQNEGDNDNEGNENNGQNNRRRRNEIAVYMQGR